MSAGAGRLAGKAAVVVGAGQQAGETMGNGRATALAFAREGASVLLVDRDRASVEETASMCEQAEVLVVDVATDDGPSAIVDAAQQAFGRIDVLHNNVGIGAGDASPTRLSEDAWDRILDVNLRAMWRTCKAVVPVMRAAERGGSIVNISSVASVAAATNLTAYKVSKAGVNALTQTLAAANARFGIRVNAILPGLIDTPMAVDAVARSMGQPREAVATARAARVPMGHQGSADDIANAAVFLASDEAAFITGVLLPVDGGQCVMVG